jgi:hypothetical protein
MVKGRLMSGARRPWNCHAPADQNRTAVTYCSGSPDLGLATSHKSRCNHLRQIASSRRLVNWKRHYFQQSKPAIAQGQRKFLSVLKKNYVVLNL